MKKGELLQRVGIPVDSFEDPVWHNVVRTYFKTVNDYVPPQEKLEMGRFRTAKDALGACDGFRFGSRVSLHSKLTVDQLHRAGSFVLVYFDFNPNADPAEKRSFEHYSGMTVDDLTQTFRSEVDKYLESEVSGAEQFTL